MTSSTNGDGTAVNQPTSLPSLTSLRFIVAVMIFLFHSTNYVLFASPNVGERFLGLTTMGAWAGMSFFFMLSGFVLTWVARPKLGTLTHWRRRLMRVYPNHLLMFVVTAIIMVTVLNQVLDTRVALLNIFLLQAWSPDLMDRIGFNSVSWSLSAELLFYVAFPVLLPLVRKIRPERLWAWLIGLLATITLAVPLAVELLPSQEVMPFLDLTPNEFWILFHFPPTRMLEFVAGMLLARIVATGRRIPVSFGGAMALTVAAYAFGPMFPPEFRMVAVMVVPLALLIASGAVSDLNRTRTTLLSSAPMVRMGNLSYSFYLMHMQVLVLGSYLLGTDKPVSTPKGFAVLALFFAVAVVLSWVMYTVVERPAMLRFGSHSRKGAAKTTPSAVPAARSTVAEPAPAAADSVTESPVGVR
ncbi:acyltransferase family protein [Streptomyces sp. H34-S4]|uniref:acyltransferase family protein n=1 Tax=Streptomyces sp. H34-S4 TaxID=2996463 RepID=UPI00226E5F16|nr:acyltransferase [Streptomyces sp. H34-S4]MCY0937604.1 acyltransferase [Streptomyces sp. H34-S4]